MCATTAYCSKQPQPLVLQRCQKNFTQDVSALIINTEILPAAANSPEFLLKVVYTNRRWKKERGECGEEPDVEPAGGPDVTHTAQSSRAALGEKDILPQERRVPNHDFPDVANGKRDQRGEGEDTEEVKERESLSCHF
ncbi:hypothetical protein DPX16_18718 [Anabarilius grahami]|uniref:Uncharacterized protein n=1 Tax=Anabarilius grahami TaxID=495550 RepID=A0A3N0Z1N6_ANAGA|nr:hypothetical protein DPX16_18718 [Anabarilius grahami]